MPAGGTSCPQGGGGQAAGHSQAARGQAGKQGIEKKRQFPRFFGSGFEVTLRRVSLIMLISFALTHFFLETPVFYAIQFSALVSSSPPSSSRAPRPPRSSPTDTRSMGHTGAE